MGPPFLISPALYLFYFLTLWLTKSLIITMWGGNQQPICAVLYLLHQTVLIVPSTASVCILLGPLLNKFDFAAGWLGNRSREHFY